MAYFILTSDEDGTHVNGPFTRSHSGFRQGLLVRR